MKSMETLHQEILENEELKTAFITALKENTIEDFLKSNGCEGTTADVMIFMNSKKEGELSDDDMEKVAGGDCGDLPRVQPFKAQSSLWVLFSE